MGNFDNWGSGDTPEDYRVERIGKLLDEAKKLRADLALEKSINKWQEIVRGVGTDRASRDCALCKLHSSGFGCGECIIKKETGFNGCKGTPYIEFIEHHDAEHKQEFEEWEKNGRGIKCEKCVEIALKVLNNLKRLRNPNPRMTAAEVDARNRHGGFRISEPHFRPSGVFHTT